MHSIRYPRRDFIRMPVAEEADDRSHNQEGEQHCQQDGKGVVRRRIGGGQLGGLEVFSMHRTQEWR